MENDETPVRQNTGQAFRGKPETKIFLFPGDGTPTAVSMQRKVSVPPERCRSQGPAEPFQEEYRLKIGMRRGDGG